MHELTEICCAAREFRAKAEPLWLATVVAVHGSAYRQPGARMLFTRDRILAGSVSGGCLEADIVRSGGWATRAGPTIRTYDATDEELAGARSGCGGRVEILLEAVAEEGSCDVLSFIDQCLAREARAVIATVLETRSADVKPGQRLMLDARSRATCTTLQHVALAQEVATQAEAAALQGKTRHYVPHCMSGMQLLIEVVDPRPALFIFGSGHDALALTRVAKLVGWNVLVHVRQLRPAVQDRFCQHARLLVCSAEAAVAELDRYARPLAVVMSHSIDADREALEALLRSRARYLGVLGPAVRTQRLLQEIRSARSRGSAHRERRVHGPAGLQLGAESPMEIALSIIAEAQAALTSSCAHSLSDLQRPIHDRAADSAELRVVSVGADR